jgi:MOSC domain-containing protein YiiM
LKQKIMAIAISNEAKGIDLLNLPTNTKLYLGNQAVIRVTGLRNPCAQLDAFQPGLMSAY